MSESDRTPTPPLDYFKREEFRIALETITGRPFELLQVDIGNEKIWAYRTRSTRVYPPNYELLRCVKGNYPKTITHSKDYATGLMDEMGKELEQNTALNPVTKGLNCFRASAIELPDEPGTYQGVLDFFVENKGVYQSIDTDALENTRQTIAYQEINPARRIRKITLPEEITKEITQEERDEIIRRTKERHRKNSEKLVSGASEINHTLRPRHFQNMTGGKGTLGDPNIFSKN